jgi:flagellar basal body rod protein FlgG
MADGIYAALSGAVAQVVSLESTAENLANASTGGYRASRPVFHELLSRAGARELHYTAIAETRQDSTPGAITHTGRALDVALGPTDFLAVQTARGERYTRAGSLHLGQDGTILAPSGDAILGENNTPLRTSGDGEISITADGEVRQGGGSVGRLKLVTFDKPDSLTPEGRGVLAAGAAAGQATPSKELVTPGAIEESNASPVRAMTDLVTAQRTFEAFQRTIEAFHEADRRVVTTVPSR